MNTATKRLDGLSEAQTHELNELYAQIDHDPNTRAKIDALLADAKASGEVIPAEQVFAALKARIAGNHAK